MLFKVPLRYFVIAGLVYAHPFYVQATSMFLRSRNSQADSASIAKLAFEQYYDANWLALNDYFRIHRARFVQTYEFIGQYCFEPAGRVLDVGGVGPVSAYLGKQAGWSVDKTDSDLRKPLAISDDFYDLVLCTETIEHIKDVESDAIHDLEAFNYSGVCSMLNELRRALKSRGKLVITTPNANSYISLHKWIGGEVLLMDPQHVREFSVAELKRVASRCGLLEVSVTTIDSWPDFGGYTAELRTLLQCYPQVSSIERGDNIIAAFGR